MFEPSEVCTQDAQATHEICVGLRRVKKLAADPAITVYYDRQP
ncbi:hypothetical protein [Ancylothrix sp. D3o]|nr:hypothetical protein [Ancylothrix sp. D3o]